METLILVFALISSISSCITSVIYAYLAFKKHQEPPKDEIWETVTRILCSCNTSLDTEDFAELYEELHFLKENPEAVKRAGSIRKAIAQAKISQE